MSKINLFNSIKKFVILAKAGIQCFQCVLDPPVKLEDDKSRVYTQTPYKYTIVSKNKFILDIRSFCARLLTRQANTSKIVIVRLDRTIQNLLKRLDSPIKSGNDKPNNFIYLLAGLIIAFFELTLIRQDIM